MTEYSTLHEILSQAEAWQDALNIADKNRHEIEKLSRDNFDQVIFTGCGSTYYLSLAAAPLFQELTGFSSRAAPGSELLLNPDLVIPRSGKSTSRQLLVAVSRSGSTSETVRAVELFKKHNHGPVIAITNYGDQPLASLADVALVIEKGQEKSVAQTRSFASMYLGAVSLCTIFAGKKDLTHSLIRLPEIGHKLFDQYQSTAKQLGEDLDKDRFYFLGSGTRYGLACEANLKMKEMTLTHSEPFHFMEFRHGPMSMVTKSANVIGLLSNSSRDHERKVLDEMKSLGGHIFGLGDKEADINFECGLNELVYGVLYLPILQLMAYFRSVRKGLNPDNPTNLTAVVKLDI